jgi:hypothetical protein
MAITINGTANTITGLTSLTSTTLVPNNIAAAAGTTTVAPITLTAGTNLASAAAGNIEYDGTDMYFTPVALQRGLVTAPQYYAIGQTSLTGPTIANTGQTATITIASPAVITVTSAPASGQIVVFTTSGTLPTGIVAGVQYFVLNLSATTFNIALTRGGAAINTSGSQSGTQTATFYSSLTNAGVSLNANTRYAYEIYTTLVKNSANAAAVQYAVTGITAAQGLIPFNFHSYMVVSNASTGTVTPSATSSMANYITTNIFSPVTVTATSTAAAAAYVMFVKGILEVGATAATNVNFTFGFTAAPTTSAVNSGTYILIYPIPGTTTTNTNVGSWV